jgi:hypothetical protein
MAVPQQIKNVAVYLFKLDIWKASGDFPVRKKPVAQQKGRLEVQPAAITVTNADIHSLGIESTSRPLVSPSEARRQT